MESTVLAPFHSPLDAVSLLILGVVLSPELDGCDFVTPTGGPSLIPPGERAMCRQCAEIDKKIEHYRLLASRVTDQPLLDGIRDLIKRMQAQKAALHPEQEQ